MKKHVKKKQYPLLRVHPLEGFCQWQNISGRKNIYIFPLWIPRTKYGITLPAVYENDCTASVFLHPWYFIIVFGIVLIRTIHPSGSRLCERLSLSPWLLLRPRKPSVPYRCPIVISQIIRLYSQNLTAHRMGRSEGKVLSRWFLYRPKLKLKVEQLPITFHGLFTKPAAGSLSHLICVLSKHSFLVVVCLLLYDVITRPGKLIA